MKKKLLKSLVVVAVIVAILGVGVAVAHQGNKYQNKKAHDQQLVVDKQVADVKTAAAAEYSSLQASYDKLRIECEKGKAAHDTLTALNKAKAAATPAPVCGPAVLR